jgi:hypothetical protein
MDGAPLNHWFLSIGHELTVISRTNPPVSGFARSGHLGFQQGQRQPAVPFQSCLISLGNKLLIG